MDEEKKEKKELSKLEKRYPRLRLAQVIFLVLSIISALGPAIVVAVSEASTFKRADEGWSLAGYAVVIIGIGVLCVCGGLLAKYRDKLPWALRATVVAWVMVFALHALRSIIDEAFWISLALAIGCSAAIILASISDWYGAIADGIEDEYKKFKRCREEDKQ